MVSSSGRVAAAVCLVLVCKFVLVISFSTEGGEQLNVKEVAASVDLEKPFVEVFPSSLPDNISNDKLKCERVGITGMKWYLQDETGELCQFDP